MIFNAAVVVALCGSASMALTAQGEPTGPKQLVTEQAKTTFPLGAVEDLPEIRECLKDLCDDVRFGLESNALDKVVRESVGHAPGQKALSEEAAVQLDEMTAKFRHMLRKEGDAAVDAFLADVTRRAPKTATVAARASHPEGGPIPYSWEVEGLVGMSSISYSTERPVFMTKTLRLSVPDRDVIIEVPLKWEGKVSLDANWEVECEDHVTGVINTPTTEVRAARWCRPKLNVSVRCEWPFSGGGTDNDDQGAPIKVTGKRFEEWSNGIGCNFRMGRYVIPLRAGKELGLEEAPVEAMAIGLAGTARAATDADLQDSWVNAMPTNHVVPIFGTVRGEGDAYEHR
jgi:hypothetical protein